VGLEVGVAVGIAVGVGIDVLVAVAVGVAVGTTVGVGVGPAWATADQAVTATATIASDPKTERRIVAFGTVLLLAFEA
jgi:hypothetical protein